MLIAVKADLVILAIFTLQITMSEENIANSFATADDRFLPPMDTDGGNIEIFPVFAVSWLSIQPVRIAVPRTHIAGRKILQISV